MNPIFKRHSIRKYSDVEVTDEQIGNLLKAGMQAPSACNQQAWEFIVVKNEKEMRSIVEAKQQKARSTRLEAMTAAHVKKDVIANDEIKSLDEVYDNTKFYDDTSPTLLDLRSEI